MNDDGGYGLLLLNYTNYYVNFPTYVFYDFLYTALLLQFVHKLVNESTIASSSAGVLLLAKKAIAHNLLSIAGVGFYAFFLPEGFVIQNIFIVFALHFLFNWKGSKYLFNPSELFDGKIGIGSIQSFASASKSLVNGKRKSMTTGSKKTITTIQVQPKDDA